MPHRRAVLEPLRARPIVVAALAALVSGCIEVDAATPPSAWVLDRAEVIGSRKVENDSVKVDIYLDGTASMAGYVSTAGNGYERFIEALEAGVRTGWKDSQVRFYKFGTSIRPLEDREAFRAAATPEFYTERGIFEKTHIDSVVERTSRNRLSIVLTDLFQDEGDVNALVMYIKERGFARGVQVGLLGVRSQFDGEVFDAGVSPYPYRSTPGQPATYRPFYALMFGDVANLTRVYQTLGAAKGVVEPRYFTLISPYLVRDYRVEVDRPPPARGERQTLNALASDRKDEFAFQFVRGASAGALQARIMLDPDPSAPTPATDRLRLVVHRKRLDRRGAWSDSAATDDLALERLQRSGDTVAVRLRVDLSRVPPGTYAYRVDLLAGEIGAIRPPAWVGELSSERPSLDNDANKTLNLEKFVTDMIQASATVRAPKLASFQLTLRKQ